MADGGIDVIYDGDGLVDHEFGQLTNRCRGALHTRAALLGTNQTYLLYFWEMLNKYQLLSVNSAARYHQRMVVRVCHQQSTVMAKMLTAMLMRSTFRS